MLPWGPWGLLLILNYLSDLMDPSALSHLLVRALLWLRLDLASLLRLVIHYFQWVPSGLGYRLRRVAQLRLLSLGHL